MFISVMKLGIVTLEFLSHFWSQPEAAISGTGFLAVPKWLHMSSGIQVSLVRMLLEGNIQIAVSSVQLLF